MLTAGLAAALCAALTVPALMSTHADQPATTNVEGLAARFADDDLFMVNSAADSSRRMYAVSRNGTSHMQLDGSLPFTLDVSYTLNGPNVPVDRLNNASGMAGVHVVARVNDRAGDGIQQLARQMRLFAFFSMPSAVVGDVSASDGVVVQRDGSAITVAATANPGSTLDFRVYADAKHFSMSPVALAVLPQSAPTGYTAQLQSLARNSTTLVNSITGENNDDTNARLIGELERLRERERVLAQQQIAQADAAHKRAFHEYMAAYVGSYTAHLSGSVGNSTQLTALVGTAGELNGDTPLARAVTNLAGAVNARSDAYQHIGAADEVDWIIRRIRQRGTQGLATELSQRAGMNSRDGAQNYAAGQKQLSNAMIPYSMAYTDAYTENLNTLTGGDVSRAQAMGAQAIAQTDAQFGSNSTLTSDQAKVDAAMNELAQAREHTGASSADRQIALRYADRFSNAAANASGAAQNAGLGTPVSAIASQVYDGWLAHSIGGKIVGARTKAIADAQAKERRQQGEDAQAGASLVAASDDDAAADVSKFAGSAAAGLGVKGGGAKDDAAHRSSDAGGSGTPHRERVPESERLATQFGVSDLASGLVLHADPSQVVDETVIIGQAQPLLEAGAAMSGPSGGLASQLAYDTADHWPNLRLLLVRPTL